MAKFLFIGDPRHGGDGPDFLTVLGHDFNRVTATLVEDAGKIKKLLGNAHFRLVPEQPEYPAPVKPAEPQLAPAIAVQPEASAPSTPAPTPTAAAPAPVAAPHTADEFGAAVAEMERLLKADAASVQAEYERIMADADPHVALVAWHRALAPAVAAT